MNNIYKVLNEMMNHEDGLSEDMKKGILIGIELMGYQTEKWLDNEEHALNFRNNTKLGDGWSGWKETYDHVAGFMYSEQPDEEQMKHCKLETYSCEDEELEEGEVDECAIDELTDWLKSDTHKKSDVFPYSNNPLTDGGPQNPLKSAEEMKEEIVLDKNYSEDMEMSEEENGEEDDAVTVDTVSSDDECYDSTNEEYAYEEESEDGSELDDWFGFSEIVYENISYLLKEDDNTVNPYSGPYVEDGVGVLNGSVVPTIEFHTFNDFEEHLKRVRESILPQNGEVVKDILIDFIERNYPNFSSQEECDVCPKGRLKRNWIEFRGNKKDGYHKGFCIELNTMVKNGVELTEQTGVLTTLPSLRDYSAYHKGCSMSPENLPLISLNEELGWSSRFTSALQQKQGDRMYMYQTKGKKLGDVMKEIEKVYTA